MAGSAALVAECCKCHTSDPKCSERGWKCIPLAVKTYGCWGAEARDFSPRLATCLTVPMQSPATAAIYGRLSRTLVRFCMYKNPVVKSWAFIGHHLLILTMQVYRSCCLRILLRHPSLMLMIPCQFGLRTMMSPASSSAKCPQRARDLPKVPAVAQGLLDNACVLAFLPPQLLSQALG